MSKPDIKIIQDPKILQQVIKAVGGEGKNHINIIMIGQINSGDPEVSKREMAELLKSLPEPRLTSLRNLAITTTMGMFERTSTAAKFLGMHRKTLTNILTEMNKDHLIEEGPIQSRVKELIEGKKDY